MTDAELTDSPVRNLSAEDLKYYSRPGNSSLSESEIDQIVEETGFDEEDIDRWVRSIERKKQGIFYGPPGTGKTFIAKKIANHLTTGTDGEVKTIQFHSAYTYEDFIQGIRPQSNGDHLEYPVVSGRFLEFCKIAEERDGTCVLIIDEINRADLSEVFGELMYLLEYRDEHIDLPHPREDTGETEFKIPENLVMIGTMNTADRSIALVDFALRRRFSFIPLWPEPATLENYHDRHTDLNPGDIIDQIELINEQIDERDFHLGYTYFMDENLEDHLPDIWKMEIEPYLEEYFFDARGEVDQFRWENVNDDISL